MPESRKLRTPKIKPRYVSSLDGLRALCALGVVGYHMRLPWCGGGLLGVTILFVLSGLLLGLAFKGGMWLFLIPFAGVACALAIMNRPRLPGGKTAPIPVVTRAIRATGLVPATTPDLRSECPGGKLAAHPFACQL